MADLEIPDAEPDWADLSRFADYPLDWLEGHGAYRAHLAVIHEEQGRPGMAQEYLAEAARWFALAAAQRTGAES